MLRMPSDTQSLNCFSLFPSNLFNKELEHNFIKEDMFSLEDM